jgi:FAD-NAD(P)-binding protein
MSVLERLLLRLAEGEFDAHIHLFEPFECGAGRIWRTSQPDWLPMNTVCGEVTIFSRTDGGDLGSLYEWLCAQPWAPSLTPNDYVPRGWYGRYLIAAFDHIASRLPDGVALQTHPTRVRDITKTDQGFRISDDDGDQIDLDVVVLTTGHSVNRPTRSLLRLRQAAEKHRLRFIGGDAPAELPLGEIAPRERVGVIGLGLNFYDVVASLTVGRQGTFDSPSNRLTYVPSGREPQMFVGSRSGVPQLGRGANQKPSGWRYHPKLCTQEAVVKARAAAVSKRGDARLSFEAEVLPLLTAEFAHVFRTTQARCTLSSQEADQFAEAHLALLRDGKHDAAEDLSASLGLPGTVPALEYLSRPFAAEKFETPAEYCRRVLARLRDDLQECELGNVGGALKAATDLLRDLRPFLRAAVDFNGLLPDSYGTFVREFAPAYAMVSTGPGKRRIAELIALAEGGFVSFVGPSMRVHVDDAGRAFRLYSPNVLGSDVAVSTLIDARMPRASAALDMSALTQNLQNRGLASEFTVIDGDRVIRGGLRTTDTPFRSVASDGQPVPGLYILGIPSEGTRWFTQIGNGRPGPLTAYHRDADDIAVDICETLSGRGGDAEMTQAGVAGSAPAT